jgi:hypothetical protein
MTQLSIVLEALEIAEKHLAYVEINEAIANVKQMMRTEPIARGLHDKTYNQAKKIAKGFGYVEPRWFKPWTWYNGVVTVG